ncbi:hypothetical protein BC830DRAFT_1150132 [Chytriomyces sp. MP71]|nr:hypothetical protein BC830DRAFT_1150132 [Chytriomyces sp. MP71]
MSDNMDLKHAKASDEEQQGQSKQMQQPQGRIANIWLMIQGFTWTDVVLRISQMVIAVTWVAYLRSVVETLVAVQPATCNANLSCPGLYECNDDTSMCELQRVKIASDIVTNLLLTNNVLLNLQLGDLADRIRNYIFYILLVAEFVLAYLNGTLFTVLLGVFFGVVLVAGFLWWFLRSSLTFA